VSEAVKIHPAITKSDGLVIYDRDNVMVDPTLYISMKEAETALANYTDADIWSVVVERKHKVNDAPRVKRGKKLRPLIIEYVKGDSLI
jgi:hypothetical protein